MAKKDKRKKGNDESVTCEIREVYGTLSNSKVYANVSWNGHEAQDEIRRYWKDGDDEIHLRKGIDMSEEDIENLYGLMEKKRAKRKKREQEEAEEREREEAEEKRKLKPVNLEEVFASAEGLKARREEGYHTEDGFYKLIRKDKNPLSVYGVTQRIDD